MPERPLRLPAILFLLFVFLGGAALAAENNMGGSAPALPADLSPEQAEMARKYLESNPEARKALEAARRQKEQEAPEEGKPGDGNTEGGKKELAPGAEGAAAAAKEDRFAAPRYDWRESPYVSRLFGSRLKDEEKRQLVHFGHELFAPRAGDAVILENMPAAPGYVIGPGDEVVVRMWGRMEGTQRLTVDRDGKIFFPKLGSFHVAGKTFEELKTFLQGKVSGIKEAHSDVSLGRTKGIRVSVIGEVRVPGWYNVSSLQTALQALSLASGVKDIGSLRRIELIREGKTVETIDLYDLLLKGDSRSDLRLLQGDTIFVPVVGKLVVIAGEVRRPAIYEMRDEKPLLEMVKVAGGFAPSAWKQRVLVERLEGNSLPRRPRRERRGPGNREGDDGSLRRRHRPRLPHPPGGRQRDHAGGERQPPREVRAQARDDRGLAPQGRDGLPPRNVLRLRAPHPPGPSGPAQGGHPRKPPGDRAGEEAGGRRRPAGAGQAHGLQPFRLPRPAQGDHLRGGAVDAPAARKAAEGRGFVPGGTRAGEASQDGESAPGRDLGGRNRRRRRARSRRRRGWNRRRRRRARSRPGKSPWG